MLSSEASYLTTCAKLIKFGQGHRILSATELGTVFQLG